MRSKNLLPVQVVMPSNWMGVTQSAHKIAFEEALHNSIENSLRSPSVTPSAVFSSLFFTYRPSSASTISVASDVKPNVDELDSEVDRPIPNSSEHIEQSSPAATSLPYFHPARPLPTASAEVRAPLALQVSTDRSQPLQEQRNNVQNENRAALPTNQPQIPLLTQQQQIEQIQQARIEQFKQLQKIQAWQQMQKEQQQQQQQQTVGSRMMLQGPREMRPPHIPGPPMRPSMPNVPRSTAAALVPTHINGMQHNGVIPPIHAAFNLRHDRPLQVANINGFCKGGKDIRLSRLEHDCSQMISPPPDYVLLALQPVLGRSDSAIVIALNLKSLPPPNSSSQALSAQCIGCGEKSIHTFPQLAAHVGIELGADTNTSRLNSSQLIGTHGRFYMLRDATNPHKLIRGSPTVWYKNNEVERMRLLGSIPPTNQTTANSSQIRGSMIMVSPPHQASASGPPQEAAVPAHPLVSPSYAPVARSHLKRALSSPIHKNPVEAGKRQYSSYSQDEVVVIRDDPTPKRYLPEERESWRKVEIPEGFSTLHETKPVIAFLYPQTNLPHFIGDITSVIVTSHFAELLNPLSQEAMKRLKLVEHCSLTYSKFVLFSTVQYLIKLGRYDTFSVEGLSTCLMECRQTFNEENSSCFSEVKSSDILLLSQLAAAGSNGLVEVIHCKISIASGISDCLQNHRPSLNKYYILVHIGNHDELTFHLFVSGNISRAIEESLRPREGLSSIVSQGLVSLQFSQLRISLSEVTKQCYHNHATSKLKSFNLKSSISLQHHCPTRRGQSCAFASALHTKVQKILNDISNFEISDFTSLEFLFLIPPSTSHFTETLKSISDANIFSEIFKSHSVSSLAKEVIITIEDNSVQKVSSICRQCENTSTLLILIQFDAHLIHDKSKMLEFLNSSGIQQSKNIFHVQCTSFPYSLLTRNSTIPIDNVVCVDRIKDLQVKTVNNEAVNSLCQSSTVFDPVYEEQREHLCNRYRLLHSSLIICEILTHQYIASFAMTSSPSASCQHQEKCDFNHIISPIINQVTRDLCHGYTPSIVIVRVTSSILATRFCDNLRQARHRLGLDESFEILLYGGDSVAPSIPLSKCFLSILQAQRSAEQDWRPSCLKDIAGIPCLIVYVGDQLVSQTLPSTVKYVDLRMAFNGNLDRFHVEQELSLASPLCVSCSESKKQTAAEKDRRSSGEQSAGSSHNHTQNNHTSNERCSENRETSFNWTPSKQNIENGFRNKEEENSESKRDDVMFDFIGLAMKEADLPAGGNSHSTNCCHISPIAIFPENVYNLIKNKTRVSLRDLLPHPATQWSESLHPRLRIQSSLAEETIFYREWSNPTERNPDFDNTEQLTNENRILLVTPPNCRAPQICCEFLRSLHGVISKALEITIYDDPEELIETSKETFHSLLANSVRRGISQVVNSCTDCDETSRFFAADPAKVTRSMIVRRCPYALSNVKRTKNLRLSATTNGSSLSQVEYCLKLATKEWILNDDGMEFKVIIPSTQTNKFHFVALEDGTVELVSLQLKEKDDVGVKTPVISVGVHGVKHGLYNLNLGSDGLTHVVIVKACDCDEYKFNLPNYIIVVLPAEFDFLGRGALKYATQLLFEHFYLKEKEFTMDHQVIWPFYLLLDDDVVAFTKLRRNSESQLDNISSSWIDISILEMIQNFESVSTFDRSGVGLRPWSQCLPTHLSRGEMFVDNYLIESCVESCIFLNCKSANKVKYSKTKFSNEDVDWSLRAAAIGLNLYRFENIAMVTKVIEPLSSEEDLKNVQSSLVTIADSELVPLYHHPALLLERYLPKCAPLMFPGARCCPENPVLCVDCCLSLGNQVCVQFVSSHVNAKPWAVNRSKKYGGLILSSPNSSIRPEFLDGFQFIDGAVVCVIGTDRSSLRQTVVSLRLESAWHFRLTDEFQTANHSVLGGIPMRPWYFLTGGKKES